jgi:hypothetical protein
MKVRNGIRGGNGMEGFGLGRGSVDNKCTKFSLVDISYPARRREYGQSTPSPPFPPPSLVLYLLREVKRRRFRSSEDVLYTYFGFGFGFGFGRTFSSSMVAQMEVAAA